jgi:PD-(D/E)XK endonuclease
MKSRGNADRTNPDRTNADRTNKDRLKIDHSAGMKIKNCKKRGEWAELVFATRALELGLLLARPWGESSGYDFTVDQGTRIVRVQVKSTIFPEGNGYSCTLKNSRGPYKKNTFDFVAAYIIPEDIWYILPEKKIRGQWSVGLHPELATSKYGKYEEAWHLLRSGIRGAITRIEASAEEGTDATRRTESSEPLKVKGEAKSRPKQDLPRETPW